MEIRLNSWLTVIALSCAAFIFNTTEFVPIGLLTLISESFEMEPAHTGYLMTIYAWCVAILSLPLTILTAKIDRRKLLLALFVIFIASHIFCAIAWSFWTLLAARLGIAAAHSIFWAITIPLAVRVAPDHAKSKAIGALIAGSSLAAVLGVPGGSFIGKEFGWRVSFAVIGIAAALIAFLLFRILPKLPSKNAGSLKSLPILLRRPTVLWVYVLTALTVAGEFTAYIYIGPFFETQGFDKSDVNWLLLAMGAAGLIGSYLYGRFASMQALMLIAPLAILCVMLALMKVSAQNIIVSFALSMVWGTVVVMIFMSLQSMLLDAAKDAADVANSIYSGIFNIGIGGGSFIGSLVTLSLGTTFVGYAGSAILLCALLLCLPAIRHFAKAWAEREKELGSTRKKTGVA